MIVLLHGTFIFPCHGLFPWDIYHPSLQFIMLCVTLPFQAQRVVGSPLRKNMPELFLGWWWTIVWIIQRMCPFSMADPENENVRAWVKGNTNMEPASLRTDKVRHYVAEIYHAVVGLITADIALLASRPLPSLCLQIDLWTSKLSGEKFMGKSRSVVTFSPSCTIHFQAIQPLHVRFYASVASYRCSSLMDQ